MAAASKVGGILRMTPSWYVTGVTAFPEVPDPGDLSIVEMAREITGAYAPTSFAGFLIRMQPSLLISRWSRTSRRRCQPLVCGLLFALGELLSYARDIREALWATLDALEVLESRLP